MEAFASLLGTSSTTTTANRESGNSSYESSGGNNSRRRSSTNLFEGKFGGTILHTYAQQHQWSRLLASASRDKLYILNEYNRTALHYAIENGAPDECVMELIKLCPNQVRVQDMSGDSPMHLGCEFGMGLIVTYAMLEADGTIARGQKSVLLLKNQDQKTPLDKIKATVNANNTSNNSNNNSTRSSFGFSSNDSDTNDSSVSTTFMKRLSSSVAQLQPVFDKIKEELQKGRPMTWKHYKEEYEAVKAVLEESANGQTGLVGLSY